MLRRKTLPDGGKGRWTGENMIYSTHMGHDEPPYDADNPILRGGQPVEEPEYLTDALTREAVDFIQRHSSKPFFLYLAYNAVHSPLQAADAYMERFAHIEDVHRRIFAAMLANLDVCVGYVLDTLRILHVEENTLVFFISDNGGPTRELTSSNLPLRGGKGDIYEGGIRVPFLVQWRGTLPAGKVFDEPVISLDVFATAAATAGAPVPKGRPIDGVDLIPYLKGEREGRPHDVLFWRMGHRTAVRAGDWKLLRDARRRSNANWQLYNLADDVSESTDLADTHSQKLEELKGVWERLNGQMPEPGPPGRR
jgi:arylsulfatase B